MTHSLLPFIRDLKQNNFICYSFVSEISTGKDLHTNNKQLYLKCIKPGNSIKTSSKNKMNEGYEIDMTFTESAYTRSICPKNKNNTVYNIVILGNIYDLKIRWTWKWHETKIRQLRRLKIFYSIFVNIRKRFCSTRKMLPNFRVINILMHSIVSFDFFIHERCATSKTN